jgi:xanthine/uracil permease
VFLTLTAWCIVSIIAFNRTDLIGLVAIMSGLVLGLITTYNFGKKSQQVIQVDQATALKYDSKQEGPKS